MCVAQVSSFARALRDSVLLRNASWCCLQRAPRGKLLKILRLSFNFSAHNAEVEGSSPSLTTKINELQLPKRGILREFVDCGAQIQARRAGGRS
jgi:hypothetical protein